MVEKWDPVPEPQDLRDPHDSQGPFMTSGSHWDTLDLLEPSETPKIPSNLQNTLRPSEPLGTQRISPKPPVFLGMWYVKSISREW